jgi:hypothetical protein
MDGGSSDMTLAFELKALKELKSPDSVFTGARQWTTYVGVISDKPTYVVTNFTRKHRIRQDFFSGPRSREESLENIMDQFDSERYVFVGVDDSDEELGESTGWEYVDLETAADAASWELAQPTQTTQVEEEPREDWP